MRTQRQLKVGEALRHALAVVFQRGDIPWPKGFSAPMVTITEVTVSPDLRNASVYFLTMGGESTKETQKVLRGMVGFFRHELAKAVNLRYVPALTFSADTSFENASTIEKILSDPAVAKDLVPKDKPSAEEEI
jgi:ribosome-binding factor A